MRPGKIKSEITVSATPISFIRDLAFYFRLAFDLAERDRAVVSRTHGLQELDNDNTAGSAISASMQGPKK